MSRFLPTLFPTAASDPVLHRVRPALEFAFFNALTWQIAVGTPMVLFAQRLGASPFAVGLAYGFLYLLMPVQVLATSLKSSAAAPVAQAAPAVPATDTKFCIDCGQPIPARAKFCAECGKAQ